MKVKRRWREWVGDGGGVDAQCETTIGHDGMHRVPTVVTETELTGLWLQCVDVTRLYHRPHQLSTHHTTDRTLRTVTPVCHEALPPSIFRSKSGKYKPTLKSMVKNRWNFVLLAQTYDKRGNDIRLTSYLSFIHFNSNATVRVAGRDDDTILLHCSEVKADLQLRTDHKLLSCTQQLNQSVVAHKY